MGRWSRPVSKNDPQGYGSAATYARRYSLAAAVGVAPDDDDDANVASERPARQTKEKKWVTKVDVEGWNLKVKLAASLGVEALNNLRPEFSALPECPDKEKVRVALNDARKEAVRQASDRIKNGQPPEQREDSSP